MAQDKCGEVRRVVGVARTEGGATGLEAENARLRAELEAAQRVIASASCYAIVTLDLAGRITGWSGGAETVLGRTAQEALGQPGDIVLVPEERAEGGLAGSIRRVLGGETVQRESWCIRRDGVRFWARGALMPLLDGEGEVQGAVLVLRDASEVQVRAERGAMQLARLRRRLRRTVTVVQAVASQTARYVEDMRAFQGAFDERLAALERAHDALMDGGWEGATLREVIARALRPHGGEPGWLALDGPPVPLAADAVVMLGLAFHELAANASTHGALTMHGGRVTVLWRPRRLEGGQRAVEIVWQERGGPRVRPPDRRGFGARLLERGLTEEFGGTVRLDFAPEGLECRIVLPLTARVAGATPR